MLYRTVENSWCHFYRFAAYRQRSMEQWQSSGNHKIAVIAAHPDDETIGAGGVAILHRLHGDDCKIFVITDGGGSRANGLSQEAMIHARSAELRTAASIMGIHTVALLFPEFKWDQNQVLEAIAPTVKDSDVIYTHSCIDYHPDHVRLANCVSRLTVKKQIVRVFEVSVPLTSVLTNLVANIQPAVSIKTQALQSYRTQVGSIVPTQRHARYLEAQYGYPVERFWQMDGSDFRYLMKHFSQMNSFKSFRALRPAPLSDPLASLAGRRQRSKIKMLTHDAL